ncbi:MAG: 50S ribosomal protein L25/general stress protein Ctc [Prevotellaceae bacterium]|jgi:large subunit ribosomal protein L25|nr:50S ribosomal protein L25/general stress protein Ctc [Prevotellaceae bacterium]
MKRIKLEGTERTGLGKKETKKSRNAQQVPCVLYGNGLDNLHFTVPVTGLKPIVYTPEAFLIDLDISGKKHLAVLRDMQFHPLTDEILHIDFFNVDETKPVAIDLPVVITGNSEGVKQGGKLQVLIRKLKVAALTKDLPDSLDVDITDVGLGKTIFVRDLSYPNISILTPPSSTVCRVKVTRAAREQTPTPQK